MWLHRAGEFSTSRTFSFSFWCFPKVDDYSHQETFSHQETANLTPNPLCTPSIYKWPQTHQGLTCQPLLGGQPLESSACIWWALLVFCLPPLTNPGLGVCSPGTPTHTPIYWLIICSTNAPPLVRDPALDQNAHQPWGFPFCSPSPLIYSIIFVFMQVCTHDYLVFCHLYTVQYLIVCIVSF